MKKITEWMRTHKLYATTAAVLIMVLLSVSAAAASGVFSPADQETGREKAGSSTSDTVDLSLRIMADKNWDENSTPAVAHIAGADESNTDVDFYHAVLPGSEEGEGTSSVSLEAGAYKAEFLSPFNQDGSVYKTGSAQNIAVSTDTEDVPAIDCTLTLIPADQVTDEMLQDIIDQTKAAIENGDETLKGDGGQAVLDKLEENVAKNPNVSDQTKQDAAAADTEVNVYDDPKTATSADNKAASSKDTSQNTSSGTDSGRSGSAGSKGSGSNSSSDQTAKTSHTHKWKSHTAKRWVSNWVTVVDTPARTVYGARLYTENSDGTWTANGETYWFENGFTSSDLAAIIKDKMKNEGYIGNYQNVSKTVPAVTHQEDQGYYEEYVDYQYCGCGATR